MAQLQNPALQVRTARVTRVTRVTRMAYSPSLWLMAIGWCCASGEDC